MGQIQAICEGRSSRRTSGTACRVYFNRCAFRGSSSLSLSLLALATFVGMMTSVTSCFVSTHVVRVPFSSQELDIAAAAGTACVKCGTHTTGKWYNWKDKPGTKICMSCFHKIQLDVAAAAGTTCVKCGTDTASQWSGCKDETGPTRRTRGTRRRRRAQTRSESSRRRFRNFRALQYEFHNKSALILPCPNLPGKTLCALEREVYHAYFSITSGNPTSRL
jgi:hypothetical protein